MATDLIADVKKAVKQLESGLPTGVHEYSDRYSYFFEYLTESVIGDEELPFDVEGRRISFSLAEDIEGENGGSDQHQTWLVKIDGDPIYVRVPVYYSSWDGVDFSSSSDSLDEVFPAVVKENTFLPASSFVRNNVEFRDTGIDGLRRP